VVLALIAAASAAPSYGHGGVLLARPALVPRVVVPGVVVRRVLVHPAQVHNLLLTIIN